MKNNNKKTLEELEADYWGTPPSSSTGLIKNIFLLRRKPLLDLDSNDIRFLISQNVGLTYIVPKAIEKLRINILEEGLYYPGDLLLCVLNLEKDYWLKNESEKEIFISLLKKSKYKIDSDIINDEIKNELTESVDRFLLGNDIN